jgi:VanZ family protein
MKAIRRFLLVLLRYWISISIFTVILVLCFIHIEGLPRTTPTNIDKIVHLLMFLGLSGTVFFDNTRYLRRSVSYGRIVYGSFLFPLIVGGVIEILQEQLTTYRSGDWKDFLFDAIGAAAGALIVLCINCFLKSKTHG